MHGQNSNMYVPAPSVVMATSSPSVVIATVVVISVGACRPRDVRVGKCLMQLSTMVVGFKLLI